MSTEVKPVEPQTNGKVATAVATELLSEIPAKAASKQGLRRAPVIAAITVVFALVIAGVIGTNVLARQYTPDGAARQYLAALESGDANSAWSQIQVVSPTQPATASLIDAQALRAALGAGKPDIKSFDITSTENVDSSTAMVSFTYLTGSGSKDAKFVVKRSGETRFAIFPVWLIVIQPTLLQFTLPADAGSVDVDDKTLALPAGKSTVAVLPVAHHITFKGDALLAPSDVSLDAFGSLAQTVAYAPAFTPDGLAKVKAAVKAKFQTCTQRTTADLDFDGACPQELPYAFTYTGQWSIVGDPTSDLSVSFDKDMNAFARGHFEMVFGYNEDGFASPRHEPDGAGYSAALVLTANEVTVGSMKPETSVPNLTRPVAATDQAAEALVSAAFAKCAAATIQYVADCPQQIGAADTSNVRWALSGNPLSGASVSFDAMSGLITVHGSFQMSATYISYGNPDSSQSFVTSYNAYLFWDGSALQLITIDGSMS